MIAILTGAGRQLLAHWPAIIAWFLAGTLANWGIIQFAGWVGAYSALAGALLLPLAILARLVSYVAMFLVVRDGMRELDAIAPLPEDASARREQFVTALLGSILPFVAFYAAWGLLRDDAQAYYQRVLDISIWAGEGDGNDGWLEFSVWTVGLVVLAFGLRWLLKRYAAKLPKWFSVFAVYLELLWVFLAATLIGDGVQAVTGWIDTRQGIVWLTDLRAWVADQLVPVAWVWEAIEWFIGEAGGIILLPLAWLVIAGVVYGQAVKPRNVSVKGRIADSARSRWATVPGWLQGRLSDVWGELVERVSPIGRALVLMWRAGPILIGGYVLLYTLLLGLESLVGIGVSRVFGPNDLQGFWMVNDQLILLAVPLIIEPLRIALVSSSYDRVVGRLVEKTEDAGAAALSGGKPASVPEPASTPTPTPTPTDQGSIGNLSSSGTALELENSSSNGPDASSGTR